MCLNLPLAGDLTSTKTYRVRRWTWLRNSDPSALADGRLTITLRRSLRPGAKSEDDSYDVAEVQEAVRGFRRFLLLNVTDAGQKDVYEVVLSGRGDTCTCDAGRYKVASGCKHRDCLRAVILAGGFDREDGLPVVRTPILVETIPTLADPAEDAWESVDSESFRAMATGEWEPCPF